MKKILTTGLVVISLAILTLSVWAKFMNAYPVSSVFFVLGEWFGTLGFTQKAAFVTRYGQYFVANLEIAALTLLLLPPTRRFGALIALWVSAGAVLTHTLTPVGTTLILDAQGTSDRGLVFFSSMLLVACSVVLLSASARNTTRRSDRVPSASSRDRAHQSNAAQAQQLSQGNVLEALDRDVAFDAEDTEQLDEAFDQLLFDVKRVFHDNIIAEHQAVLNDSVRMLDDLPTQSKYFPRRPLIIPKLIRAVNNVASSKKDLVAVISHDPVLAGELLRVANSPYYRLSDEPVDSIGRAIVVLGIDGLKSMASTLVMQPVLQVKTSYFPKFSETVWLHAVKAALAAQAYARKTGACDSFQAHLIGLLSSIGHIVIFQMMMDIYRNYSGVRPKIEVLRTLRREHADQVSAIVVREWNLSEEFVEVLQAYQRKAPVNKLAPLGRALYYGRCVATLHMLFEAGKYDQDQIDSIVAERGLNTAVFAAMWKVLNDDKASLTAGTMVNTSAATSEPLRKSA